MPGPTRTLPTLAVLCEVLVLLQLLMCADTLQLRTANNNAADHRHSHLEHEAACTYASNTNITAPDMSPSKFVVSSFDCCSYCSNTDGCVAAVFYGYYCHLKSAVVPQIGAQGVTVVLQSATTTTKTTTTTVAPAITTTTTSTAAPPATTVAPAITTVAPAGPQMTVIREVTCTSSAQCSQLEDDSCYTTFYYNNTCIVNQLRVCNTDASVITVVAFAELDCITTLAEETAGVCQLNASTYHGHYCDIVPVPAVNVTVTRSICESCDGDCVEAHFVTGQCVATNQLQGLSTIAWCFPDYVVYESYISDTCSGDVEPSLAEPRGQCFRSMDGSDFTMNECGSP
ncbi:Hypothetical protein, putative [Bodo saltans]|uniref:Membrane-associated protein n=1 Tax=Bodo saltans TaxID=75058 RepID=A0A0S4JN44_BODSA|nr:Hypothetical protein, putative [Bodo saltans]|eukprot:CUG91582.1 Hypothetical protein, putative [Bodo saltans]